MYLVSFGSQSADGIVSADDVIAKTPASRGRGRGRGGRRAAPVVAASLASPVCGSETDQVSAVVVVSKGRSRGKRGKTMAVVAKAPEKSCSDADGDSRFVAFSLDVGAEMKCAVVRTTEADLPLQILPVHPPAIAGTSKAAQNLPQLVSRPSCKVIKDEQPDLAWPSTGSTACIDSGIHFLE